MTGLVYSLEIGIIATAVDIVIGVLGCLAVSRYSLRAGRISSPYDFSALRAVHHFALFCWLNIFSQSGEQRAVEIRSAISGSSFPNIPHTLGDHVRL